ncbi:MAG: hypothetical protein HY290_33250 [Planctomycetia bacterium]|nr:hypothetical protein [Planctomycetia bacterium]
MAIPARVSTDLVEELRLRRWAREHYVAAAFRDQLWHTVVLDEMRRRDDELAAAGAYAEVARRVVPLAPDRAPTLRGPHTDLARTPLHLRVPVLE